jgi:hypothetical protein
MANPITMNGGAISPENFNAVFSGADHVQQQFERATWRLVSKRSAQHDVWRAAHRERCDYGGDGLVRHECLYFRDFTLAGGTLQLRDNGVGSSEVLDYSTSDVTVVANAGSRATTGVANLDVNRASGANVSNTCRLGALNIGAQQLDVTGGSGYSVEFVGFVLLTGTPTINVATADLRSPRTVSSSSELLTAHCLLRDPAGSRSASLRFPPNTLNASPNTLNAPLASLNAPLASMMVVFASLTVPFASVTAPLPSPQVWMAQVLAVQQKLPMAIPP